MPAISKVIINHGTMGNPQGNWFPWLAKRLRDRDYSVIVPEYPTPEGQSLESWLSTFKRVAGNIDAQSIIIGHSISAAFSLRILETIPCKIRCTYLVSGFTTELGLPEYDRLNSSFIKGIFDWDRIKAASSRFRVIHGTDDPYVPLQLGEELAKSLAVPLTSIHQGGHLNSESGYNSFEYLLADILALKH